MLYNPEWEQKVKLEPWRETLLDAADLIDKRGHAKFTLQDDKGGLCILGAIAVATSGGIHTPLGQMTLDICEKLARNSFTIGRDRDYCAAAVCSWNNSPERTKDEVVDELRRVALA